ncbi:MAG: chemotaxis protein CheW [Deltaproteobacteria bacterium]|nr:chemotaxis protein CheW [Deltaproteobacteria bacterium]
MTPLESQKKETRPEMQLSNIEVSESGVPSQLNTAQKIEIVANSVDYTAEKEALYATFLLDGREFALDVAFVREAISLTTNIIKVPCDLKIVEGIINLRGSVIPIINLRTRFALPDTSFGADCRIAITKCSNSFFGLIFDSSHEVLRVQDTDISSMGHADEATDNLTCGVISLHGGERLIQILDPESLFKGFDLPMLSDRSSVEEDAYYRRKQNVAKAITFTLNKLQYVTPLEAIQEAIEVPEISTRIQLEEYIEGVFSLRGQLTTVIDLRSYWGIGRMNKSDDARVLILSDYINLGVLVDSISDVIEFNKDDIVPIPTIDSSSAQAAISGLLNLRDGENAMLIDFSRLLTRDVERQLQGAIRLHEENGSRKEAGELSKKNDDLPSQAACRDAETERESVYITFRLEEVLAAEIDYFQEIVSLTDDIMPVPGQAQYMAGVLNLRGEAIPIINLRSYYGIDAQDAQVSGKILIVRQNDIALGIVVDDICEILTIRNSGSRGVQTTLKNSIGGAYQRHIERVVSSQNREGKSRMAMIFDIKSFIAEHSDRMQS